MTTQSPTLMRCERCRAVISTAEATELIHQGAPCGVCGGRLTVCGGRRATPSGGDSDGAGRRPSAERRLLGVLREADGRPVGPRALTQAGFEDPANTIYELERAGYRIERAYTDVSAGRRRFLGYRLGRATGRLGGGFT
jgi:hypothetical protein